MEIQDPFLSIWMITYNHEKFIRQSIDGVLIQKTSFPIELIIGDDCSNDNTSKIIKEYVKKHPGLIKARFNPRNIGMIQNVIKTLEECSGKYVAMLEGDDYWTDPYKLQKQVDFMETYPEYSITSHRYKILDEENQKLSLDFAHELFKENIEGLKYDKNTFLSHQYTQTMTVVFRRDLCNLNLFSKLKSGDLALFYCCLINGLGYCFNFDGAVYRRHEGGIYSKADDYEKIRRGFYFHRTMYKNTSENVFKKHYESHFDMLLGQIKAHIGKIDLRVRKDIHSILVDDYYWRNYKLLIIHFKKILSWKFKSLFK